MPENLPENAKYETVTTTDGRILKVVTTDEGMFIYPAGEVTSSVQLDPHDYSSSTSVPTSIYDNIPDGTVVCIPNDSNVDEESIKSTTAAIAESTDSTISSSHKITGDPTKGLQGYNKTQDDSATSSANRDGFVPNAAQSAAEVVDSFAYDSNKGGDALIAIDSFRIFAESFSQSPIDFGVLSQVEGLDYGELQTASNKLFQQDAFVEKVNTLENHVKSILDRMYLLEHGQLDKFRDGTTEVDMDIYDEFGTHYSSYSDYLLSYNRGVIENYANDDDYDSSNYSTLPYASDITVTGIIDGEVVRYSNSVTNRARVDSKGKIIFLDSGAKADFMKLSDPTKRRDALEREWLTVTEKYTWFDWSLYHSEGKWEYFDEEGRLKREESSYATVGHVKVDISASFTTDLRWITLLTRDIEHLDLELKAKAEFCLVEMGYNNTTYEKNGKIDNKFDFELKLLNVALEGKVSLNFSDVLKACMDPSKDPMQDSGDYLDLSAKFGVDLFSVKVTDQYYLKNKIVKAEFEGGFGFEIGVSMSQGLKGFPPKFGWNAEGKIELLDQKSLASKLSKFAHVGEEFYYYDEEGIPHKRELEVEKGPDGKPTGRVMDVTNGKPGSAVEGLYVDPNSKGRIDDVKYTDDNVYLDDDGHVERIVEPERQCNLLHTKCVIVDKKTGEELDDWYYENRECRREAEGEQDILDYMDRHDDQVGVRDPYDWSNDPLAQIDWTGVP